MMFDNAANVPEDFTSDGFDTPEEFGAPDMPMPTCRTAFTIVQKDDGKWEATPGVASYMDPEHLPSLEEMRSGAEWVGFEIGAHLSAVINAQYQMQVAAQMRKQMEFEATKKKLHIPT